MAFRVFLSYSLDQSEQALAWRLQTLASAHGIEVFVPPRGPGYTALPSPGVASAIDRSDCVLAIINAKADAGVQRELKHALAKRKLVIPIVHSELAHNPLLTQFPRVFNYIPGGNPGKVETEVVEYLKQQRVAKDKQQAIGALVALGLGLLALFALSEK